jgi:hypothetical protein
MGCATTGRNAYEAAPAGPDRAIDGDPRSSGQDDAALKGPVLERGAFIRAVLHRNRSIESARQAWRAALARFHQSGALDDPMVTLDFAPLSIAAPGVRFGWDATISQRLPWPGKLSLDEAVASAEADATRSDFESARRELALTASLLFDQYFRLLSGTDQDDRR